MTKATYKRKHPIWGSGFQRVRVHDRHGREHGSIQADRVLTKEPRVLYSDPQAAGRESYTGLGLRIGNMNAHPPTHTHTHPCAHTLKEGNTKLKYEKNRNCSIVQLEVRDGDSPSCFFIVKNCFYYSGFFCLFRYI